MSEPDRPWWDSFFAGAWQDVHLELRTARQTEAECDFLDEALELDGTSRVLDVPCGNGRHSVELASRGCDVTGVDFNPSVLEVANRRAKRRLVAPRWLQGDMRHLEFDGEFDAAFNFWGSFGYFDAHGDAALACGVGRALRPGGRFLVDTPVVESLLPNFQQRAWYEVGDKILLEDRTYDEASSRVETEWTVIADDGERSQMRSSIRLYKLTELQSLLRSAGFSAFEPMCNLQGHRFEAGSPRLYLLAIKGRS